MCEQTEINYLDGEVVWVKLGSCWWPGEVVAPDKLPSDVMPSFRKPPIAVVKFFQEDTYEYVKNINLIYKYNCSRKHEFINKGLYMYRTKHGPMEKFPEDIIRAETAVGGDIEILTRDEFQEPKKESYAGLFGDPALKKTPGSLKKGKGRGRPVESVGATTPIRKMKEKTDYKVHILVQRSSTPSRNSIETPSTPTTSTENESAEAAENKSEPVPAEDQIQTPEKPQNEDKPSATYSTPTVSGSGIYSCHACSFSTSRLNVLILHNKTHSVTFMPYTPSPIKKKVTKSPVKSTPTTSKTTKTPKPRKEKTEKVTKKVSQAIKRASEEPKEMSDVKKPKTDQEIKSSLLADWDDVDEESNDESASLMAGSPEVAVAAESPAVPTSAELPSAQVPMELPLPEENKPEEALLEKPESTSDSKYEFCEDEDWPVEAGVGRMIPRVKNASKRKEDAKSLSLDEDDVAKEVAELLNKTTVPELPSVPEPLKVEENFPEPSVVKSPDKQETVKSPENCLNAEKKSCETPPTKAIFKTKTFFRSRHSRSQDAIGKYVAEQLNAVERMDMSEIEMNGSDNVSSPEARISPPIEHVKVTRLAPKIQLKKMKAEALQLREKEKGETQSLQGDICFTKTTSLMLENEEFGRTNSVCINKPNDNKLHTEPLQTLHDVLYPTQEIKPVNENSTKETKISLVAQQVPQIIDHITSESDKNINKKVIVEENIEHKVSGSVKNQCESNLEVQSPNRFNDNKVEKASQKTEQPYMNESTASAVDALLSVSREADRVTRNIGDDPPEDLFEDDIKDNVNTINGFNEVVTEEKVDNENQHLELLTHHNEANLQNSNLNVELKSDCISPQEDTDKLPITESIANEKSVVDPILNNCSAEVVVDNVPSESDLQIAEALINLPATALHSKSSVYQENLKTTLPEEKRVTMLEENCVTMREEKCLTMPENKCVTMLEDTCVTMPEDNSVTLLDKKCVALLEDQCITMPEDECATMPEEKFVTRPEDKFVTMPEDKFVTMLEDKFVTISEDKFVTMPEDKCVAMPEDKCVTMPEDKCVTLPEDKFVTMSEDKCVTMPEDKSIIIPDDKCITTQEDKIITTLEEKCVTMLDENCKTMPEETLNIETVLETKNVVVDDKTYETVEGIKPIMTEQVPELAVASDIDNVNIRFETEQEKSENLTAAQSLVQMSESIDHKINIIDNTKLQLNKKENTTPDAFVPKQNNGIEKIKTELIVSPLSTDNKNELGSSKTMKYENTSKLLKILEEPVLPKLSKVTPTKQIIIPGKEKILNFDIAKSSLKNKSQSPPVIIRRSGPAKTLINNSGDIGSSDKIILSRSNKSQPDGSSVKTYAIQSTPDAPSDSNTITIIQQKVRKVQKPTTKLQKIKPLNSISSLIDAKSIKESTTSEDTMFDINSMPIVLSDELLTPESIEKMPIVMSDGNLLNTSNPPKLVKTRHTIVESEKTNIIMPVSKPEVKTLLMNPVSEINKVTTSPNILSKSSKLRGAKPMLVIDKATGKQKIIMTKTEPTIKELRPAQTLIQPVAQNSGKPEKFIILPTSGSPRPGRTQKIVIDPQTGKAHVLVAKGSDNMNDNKPVSAKLIPSSSDASGPGNTVMIITNAQGAQSRIVLTSEHEKILFPNKQPQQNVSQLKTITHRISTNPANIQKAIINTVPQVKTQTRIVPKQKSAIITSKGQLIVGGRLASAGPNIAPMPEIRPVHKRIVPAEPKKIVQAIQKSNSEPLIFLQQKSGSVVQMTASQFEHFQRTGQIVQKIQVPHESKSIVQKTITISPGESGIPTIVHKQRVRKTLTEAPMPAKKMKQEIAIAPAPMVPVPALTPLSNTVVTTLGPAISNTVSVTTSSSYPDLDNLEDMLPSTAIVRQPEPVVAQPEPTPPPLSDGQLLAVPGEHFGGPPGSFYLCVEDNGTLTPIDNRPLVLENNQLVPMAVELLPMLTQPPERRDILEAALANSDVFHADPPRDEVPDFRDLNANVSVHCRVSETSTTLNQPIMTPVEVPSKVDSEPAVPSNLEDGLAVIGVTPHTVPTSLELPITVTDPRIAPKTTDPLSGNNYRTSILPSPSTEMSFVSTEEVGIPMGGSISMPLLTDDIGVGKSMPILTDEVAERTVSSLGSTADSTVGSPSSIDVRELEAEDGCQWSRRLLTPASDMSENSSEIPLQPAIQLSVNDMTRHS